MNVVIVRDDNEIPFDVIASNDIYMIINIDSIHYIKNYAQQDIVFFLCKSEFYSIMQTAGFKLVQLIDEERYFLYKRLEIMVDGSCNCEEYFRNVFYGLQEVIHSFDDNGYVIKDCKSFFDNKVLSYDTMSFFN